MRVNGEWLLCDDGEVRPIVPGLVQLADGQWHKVAFLLDAGADRTVFSPDLFNLLWPMQTAEFPSSQLAGIGGQANTITIETAIGFTKADGRPAVVRGTTVCAR